MKFVMILTHHFYLILLLLLCLSQDATENDVVGEDFDVKGYPTLYFRSASGKITSFEGDRSKEAIIEFIENTKDKTETETTKVEEKVVKEESPKDEL